MILGFCLLLHFVDTYHIICMYLEYDAIYFKYIIIFYIIIHWQYFIFIFLVKPVISQCLKIIKDYAKHCVKKFCLSCHSHTTMLLKACYLQNRFKQIFGAQWVNVNFLLKFICTYATPFEHNDISIEHIFTCILMIVIYLLQTFKFHNPLTTQLYVFLSYKYL